MANLPILSNLMEDFDRELDSMSYYDTNFGLGLLPHYLRTLRRLRDPFLGNVELQQAAKQLEDLRQLSNRSMHGGGGGGGQHRRQDAQRVALIGKDGFQACMDVTQFKPNELSVKVVGSSIVVEGKHEEREDPYGHVARHFVRRYSLPKGYDPTAVVSTLSSDGVLTVCAPKPQLESKDEERVVAIQQTGPAHLNVKENAQEKVGDSNAENDNKNKNKKQ